MLRPLVLSLALATAVAAPSALATAPTPAAVEHLMSMPVEGRIVIETDGSVREYSLDTKLSPQLAEMLGKAIRSWRFEPVLVDGMPHRAEARMRVSLAAQQAGKDYQVRVDNVVFLDSREAVAPDRVRPPPPVTVSARSFKPPHYPGGLMKAGVEARVLVALHFTPDGKMIEVLPVQTMIFDRSGEDAVLAQAIEQFEAATVAAAKDWRVNVEQRPGLPTTAKDFTAYTTVQYVMSTPSDFGRPRTRVQLQETAGKWRTVARSGKHELPWLSGLNAPEVGVADVENGEMVPLAGTPKLKTPVAGTTL